MTRPIGLVLFGILSSVPLRAQAIPTPQQHFGFEIGEDRKLADWDQLTSWYALLAQHSPRVTVDTLGPTTLGAPFVMLTVCMPCLMYTNHPPIEHADNIDRLNATAAPSTP